ncbi:MAG: MASE1 domain-containing protein, partial [Chloroflexota bacterium]
MKVFKREAQNTSTTGSSKQTWRQVGVLVLVACVYWGVVRLGLLLVAQPEGVASIWPASGLALAVLLLSAKKQWPKLLAVIFFSNIAGNLSGGNTLVVSLGFAMANSIEAFLAGWLLTTVSDSKINFQNSRQIFTLFAAAIFGNGLTSLLGAAVPTLVSGAPFFKTWLVWWSADGLGMILIAPLIVTWATSRNLFHAKTPLKIIEGTLLVVGLAGFSWLIFGSFSITEGPAFGNYIFFPLLIWLAFRFSPRGMASDLIIMAVIGLWNILNGDSNPAFGNMTVTEQLVNFQIFLSVLAFSGFLMSAIITERKQTEQALRNAEEFNKTIIAHSPIGISVRSRTGGLLSANSAWKNIWG